MNKNLQSPMTTEQKRLALLRRRRGESDASTPVDTGIPALDHDGPVPASFAQQRLWFLDRLAPGNPFYTVSLELPLNGVVYPDHLENALLEIARRHDALRTTFAEEDGQPVQILHREPQFPMERIDLSGRPQSVVMRMLGDLSAEETARSFDLMQGPLAVARLVRLSASRHLLLLTLHHIVCDGWSLKVLGRELTEIYQALVTGRPHTLPDLTTQYRDFAVWQRDLLNGTRMAGHLDYWRTQLKDAPELSLPVDFQRPAIPTYGGAFVPFELDAEYAGHIQALCSKEGYTPFMVLLSAWMVLLGRYSDMDDILVAAPSAGRERRELEAMIGFFVNTLVLRGDLSGEPTFREVVSRVRDTCLEAFSHDEFPFDRLIEELAPQRRGDRNPLAQVVFQLFSAPDRTVGNKTPEERQRGTSKFDLRLDLWDTDEGYAGELEYSTDLYDHATAELMAEQFQVLLHQLLTMPDQPVAEAGVMSQREFDWLMENTNQSDRPWPQDAGIVECFEQIAAGYADSVALDWHGRTCTYTQVDRASDGVAAWLSDMGVAAGDHVGVFLPRSPEMVISWLGILKLGAVYVPLDTDTPIARVQGLLESIDAAAVVSDADHAAIPGGGDRPVLSADISDWLQADPWQRTVTAPGDVANIMFTSGSTGKPKAVLVPHEGIVRLATVQEFWRPCPGDGIAQASNCAFDAATLEVWTALLNGCRLVGVERDELLSPVQIGQRITAGDFDHIFVTTALFHRLTEEAPGIFAPLKTLITGGSRLEPDCVRRVVSAGRPDVFVNAYGPTEATTLGTTWQIGDFDQPLVNVPIGEPIVNTTAYILDRQGTLVPRNVPGELFLGGPGVALGYLGDPDQSSRKFGPSPFREGERLYATGDRVRMRHDGSIDFLGRYDDQMKIRGFRVEPDEIATALQSHPRIAEAQALISKAPGSDGSADNRVMAFYLPVSDDDAADTVSETEDEAVAYWQKIYDEVVYQDVGAGPDKDAQFDITGWTDTATGALLSEDDMAEQVRQTCDRILALGGGDILEFGCGTGLIMFPLAPHVKSILGIDISERALEHVRSTAEASELTNISVRQGSAEAIADIADDSFDTVVLNSTVQYFPSAEYLETLIGELLRVTRPGGAVFLGDIRHLGLLEAFQTEIELNRADGAAAASAVWGAVTRRVEEEQELLLDPHWFTGLRDRFAGLGDVSIQLKRGEGHNELARFRYDVVLRPGERTDPGTVAEISWGGDVTTLDDVLDRAPAKGSPDLIVRGVPNARTAQAVGDMQMLRDAPVGVPVDALVRSDNGAESTVISPEAVWRACDNAGLSVQIVWNADPACFDLRLSADTLDRGTLMPAVPPGTDACLTSNPARGRGLRRLETELGTYLEQLLPDYMLPQGYVRLSQMPLNANGKVDRKALAASVMTTTRGPARPPRTDTEQRLAEIFCAVLQVPQVGLDDDFFRLGGHSLKATQVISRIATEFGVTVPLRAIFENGTVAGLTGEIERAKAGDQSPAITASLEEPDIDTMNAEDLERALALLEAETGDDVP
ncbi:non-ribosomal peptide synthetase [uncultured Roseobacter sp.]|uniref:non-ribosomal peptide synthetase n=1 Tax=uncultured Roseobacter sp. TaxID=114847 RepID=UPI00262C80E6|nr:non-ribosomal peptide synthetase [uncultured Roseobacter sp.]